MTEGIAANKSIIFCLIVASHFGAMRAINKAVKTDIGIAIKATRIFRKIVLNSRKQVP